MVAQLIRISIVTKFILVNFFKNWLLMSLPRFKVSVALPFKNLSPKIISIWGRKII